MEVLTKKLGIDLDGVSNNSDIYNMYDFKDRFLIIS